MQIVNLAAKVQRVEVVLFHTGVAFRREFTLSFCPLRLLFESLSVGAVDEAQSYQSLGVAAGRHFCTGRRRVAGVCARGVARRWRPARCRQRAVAALRSCRRGPAKVLNVPREKPALRCGRGLAQGC